MAAQREGVHGPAVGGKEFFIDWIHQLHPELRLYLSQFYYTTLYYVSQGAFMDILKELKFIKTTLIRI